VSFDAVIGTAEGQTAVAPGSLLRSWTHGGRSYFHYATNAPIRNGFAIDSAAYAIHRSRWRHVAIEILHDPRHSANLERMTRGMQAALETYATEIGPYPYTVLRLVETPGLGVGMHSDPIDISYSEGFAMIHPEADARDVDLVFAVVAHEVAHQWWGNQVSPAAIAGAPLVTESLAWYSAMNVIEKVHGPEHLARFLDVLRDEYSNPRSRAGVPLLEANDWFSAYRRGALAMYALREGIGRAQMDLALRRFLTKYRTGGLPLPASRDLYAELEKVTPTSQRPLLADLFERNTFWDLSTRRVAAERAGENEWLVTIDVSARKFTVDRTGVETVRPMNDEVEIGVYGGGGTPLYLERHRIRSGNQSVTLRMTGQPVRAGIDPRQLLPDPRWSDNVAEVPR
jgi:aminopeptidase N